MMLHNDALNPGDKADSNTQADVRGNEASCEVAAERSEYTGDDIKCGNSPTFVVQTK